MQNQPGALYGAQKQNNNGISSSAVSPQTTPQTGYKDVFYQLEQAIGADVQKLRMLVQNGIITETQGQNLMADLARKAQQVYLYKNSAQAQSQNPQAFATGTVPSASPVQSPMEMFNQERPGFFEGDGRADVLNYIKGLDMDKDEILQISQLVEKLENSAVDKYLKKAAYEKSLNDENAAAKRKLMSYAQNSASDGNMNRIFTREDIGNMSGAEFDQNESAIMDQLKQGLIK